MFLSRADIKRAVFYDKHYEPVADYPLVAGSPIRLSDHDAGEERLCRFCGRGTGETTFRKRAHVVPESLGNKSLLSLNECDVCNKFFADEYEDHLAKWFGPFRTVCQMHGKKGVPAYKEENIRIEMGDRGLHFEITAPELFRDISEQEGPIAFKLPVSTPSQPYVPIRAAMALVKIACSVCPKEDLHQCHPAIAWLLGQASVKMSGVPVLYAFTPGPDPYKVGKVMLLRRKGTEPLPYLWCLVASSNHRFQFFVPLCPNDKTWLKIGGQSSFSCHHFPAPFGADWPYGETKYDVFDWSGHDPVRRNPEVTLNIDRARRVK